MSIGDVEKIGYKKELERNINTFIVKDILITIYDNPMRVVREFDTVDDGHTYKTWNKDGIVTFDD